MGSTELREVQALGQETQQQNIRQSTIFLTLPQTHSTHSTDVETHQEPVTTQRQMPKPRSQLLDTPRPELGVYGVPVPPSQDGLLILSEVPCNAGYTVGTQLCTSGS